jgi:hypothetical protein
MIRAHDDRSSALPQKAVEDVSFLLRRAGVVIAMVVRPD